MPEIKPDIAQLRTDTDVAVTKANAQGLLTKIDFDDMTDGTVSNTDKEVAGYWVSALSGFLDEGSLTNLRTRLGLHMRLRKDLSREKAREMLSAATELQGAIRAQYDAQGIGETLLENAKDELHLRSMTMTTVRHWIE